MADLDRRAMVNLAAQGAVQAVLAGKYAHSQYKELKENVEWATKDNPAYERLKKTVTSRKTKNLRGTKGKTTRVKIKNNISNNKMHGPSYRRTFKNAPKKLTKSKKLTNQVKDLRKAMLSDQALHTHRRRDVNKIGSNDCQIIFSEFAERNTTALESAMGALRYYDPSVPGTLVTADASTGTYTRQIHFKSISDKLTVRNNYVTPCHVKVYSCVPKVDTNIGPTTFFSNGLSDQIVGTGATTSPLIHMTDVKMVVDNWNVKMVKSKLLQGGAQFSCTNTCKGFDYDPSNVDTHSLQYQKKYKAHVWVIKVEGALAHDTSAAQYGILSSAVDVMNTRTYKITYDAGVNLTDISVDDNSASVFTNNAVVTNRPVADNQDAQTA